MLEIERKFLVEIPDTASRPFNTAECWHIEQVYLRGDTDRRVRRIQAEDDSFFYYTSKRRLNPLVRQEREREITPDLYQRLLAKADPRRRPLMKTRWRMMSGGYLWELDLFDRYPGLAILEVELLHEQQVVDPPAFFSVIREVTGDPRYYGRSLALRDDKNNSL